MKLSPCACAAIFYWIDGSCTPLVCTAHIMLHFHTPRRTTPNSNAIYGQHEYILNGMLLVLVTAAIFISIGIASTSLLGGCPQCAMTCMCLIIILIIDAHLHEMLTSSLKADGILTGSGWVMEAVGGARRGKASHDADFLLSNPDR